VVATGGNQRQIDGTLKPQKTSQIRCHRLHPVA
jgi:hypothetical protein